MLSVRRGQLGRARTSWSLSWSTRQLARGLSNAELLVGEATVKTHVARLLAKLGVPDGVQVRGPVQAVILAYETGVVVRAGIADRDLWRRRRIRCREPATVACPRSMPRLGREAGWQEADSAIIQMKTSMKEEVAAFPGARLRHFQKCGSVKEELKRSGSRVQVQLKLMGTAASK